MNNTSINRSPAGSLRELAETKVQYDELLGWPVSIDVGRQRVMLRVGDVLDAVTMPSALADEVQTVLRTAMLAGPVICDPGDQSRTFLTQSAIVPPEELATELARAGICFVKKGSRVIVPGALHENRSENTHGWIDAPQPKRFPLPPWWAVVTAAKRVVVADTADVSP